jgi:hypothetical protein
MSTITRVVWSLTLCIFVSGCAGYRPATLSGLESPEAEESDSVELVEVGSQVKITKTTGVIVAGEVVRISDDNLVLEIAGNNGLEAYHVAFDDIRSVEMKKGSKTVGLVLIGAAVAVLVVVIVDAITNKSAEAATSFFE